MLCQVSLRCAFFHHKMGCLIDKTSKSTLANFRWYTRESGRYSCSTWMIEWFQLLFYDGVITTWKDNNWFKCMLFRTETLKFFLSSTLLLKASVVTSLWSFSLISFCTPLPVKSLKDERLGHDLILGLPHKILYQSTATSNLSMCSSNTFGSKAGTLCCSFRFLEVSFKWYFWERKKSTQRINEKCY